MRRSALLDPASLDPSWLVLDAHGAGDYQHGHWPGELRAMLEPAGFRTGERIITVCDGGGRAALTALAAVQSGFTQVEAEYLSFSDWAKDESCPIVRDGDDH